MTITTPAGRTPVIKHRRWVPPNHPRRIRYIYSQPVFAALILGGRKRVFHIASQAPNTSNLPLRPRTKCGKSSVRPNVLADRRAERLCYYNQEDWNNNKSGKHHFGLGIQIESLAFQSPSVKLTHHEQGLPHRLHKRQSAELGVKISELELSFCATAATRFSKGPRSSPVHIRDSNY
jgi:hypothetical protein